MHLQTRIYFYYICYGTFYYICCISYSSMTSFYYICHISCSIVALSVVFVEMPSLP